MKWLSFLPVEWFLLRPVDIQIGQAGQRRSAGLEASVKKRGLTATVSALEYVVWGKPDHCCAGSLWLPTKSHTSRKRNIKSYQDSHKPTLKGCTRRCKQKQEGKKFSRELRRDGVSRLCLGRRSDNLSPVAQRNKTTTNIAGSTWVVGREFECLVHHEKHFWKKVKFFKNLKNCSGSPEIGTSCWWHASIRISGLFQRRRWRDGGGGYVTAGYSSQTLKRTRAR